MVRIGWLPDPHVHPAEEVGPGERLTTDIVSLFEEYGIEKLYVNGDLASGHGSFDDSGYEHTPPEYYNRFWKLVDDSGYGDHLVCTPGNHDVPLQHYLASDDRARLRYKEVHEGVTVLMVNTVGPGWVSGSPECGYGWTNGYVPYGDLRWLDDELAAAGDDAKVVYFHHHAWLTPGDPLASAPTDTQSIDQLYWVCRNYRAIHDVLSSYENVICPQGHTAQYATEGSSRVDGVEYLYKKHYADIRPDTSPVTTYAYLEVDRERCTVTTIDHDSGAENVVLDTTF